MFQEPRPEGEERAARRELEDRQASHFGVQAPHRLRAVVVVGDPGNGLAAAQQIAFDGGRGRGMTSWR